MKLFAHNNNHKLTKYVLKRCTKPHSQPFLEWPSDDICCYGNNFYFKVKAIMTNNQHSPAGPSDHVIANLPPFYNCHCHYKFSTPGLLFLKTPFMFMPNIYLSCPLFSVFSFPSLFFVPTSNCFVLGTHARWHQRISSGAQSRR